MSLVWHQVASSWCCPPGQCPHSPVTCRVVFMTCSWISWTKRRNPVRKATLSVQRSLSPALHQRVPAALAIRCDYRTMIGISPPPSPFPSVWCFGYRLLPAQLLARGVVAMVAHSLVPFEWKMFPVYYDCPSDPYGVLVRCSGISFTLPGRETLAPPIKLATSPSSV